jgi:hypothetical protein
MKHDVGILTPKGPHARIPQLAANGETNMTTVRLSKDASIKKFKAMI